MSEASKSQPPPGIVILTGAGISQESGIATFSGADGIWANVRIEDVATPEAFARDPNRVQEFYNARRRQLLSGTVKPNAAHLALAKLEREYGGEILIVTQNVDNLHEQAGSKSVLHMHGELLKSRCAACSEVGSCDRDMDVSDVCPRCGKTGTMRPHVVWFGEIPMFNDEIDDAIRRCGIFLSIGTSGNVYPAAGLVEVARRAGAHTVELNLEPSTGASRFAKQYYGPATKIVPAYAQMCLSGAQNKT